MSKPTPPGELLWSFHRSNVAQLRLYRRVFEGRTFVALEHWSLIPDGWNCRREQQSERYAGDVWENDIEAYLASKTQVQVRDILETVFRLEVGRCGQVEQNRVVRCLTRLGWERFSYRPKDATNTVRAYRPSTTTETPKVSTTPSTPQSLTTKGKTQSVDTVDGVTLLSRSSVECEKQNFSSHSNNNQVSTVSTVSTDSINKENTSTYSVDTLVDTPKTTKECRQTSTTEQENKKEAFEERVGLLIDNGLPVAEAEQEARRLLNGVAA